MSSRSGLDRCLLRSLTEATDFKRLTQIPVAVYCGDNVPTEPTDIAGRDNWLVRFAMARLWVAISRRGGDATLVVLPEIGITGNTHSSSPT